MNKSPSYAQVDAIAGVGLDSTIVGEAAPRGSRRPFYKLTILLHWITVLMVLTMIGSGLLHDRLDDTPWATPLLRFHGSLGVTVWATTVFRLLWRITGARFPDFPASMTPVHRMAARLSEYALYVLLLA